MHKYIVIHGFNASGSSLLRDLLSNNESFLVFPEEFHYYRMIGGLRQLREDLFNNYSSFPERDYAVRSFENHIREYLNITFKSKFNFRDKNLGSLYKKLNLIFRDFVNNIMIDEFAGYSYLKLFGINRTLYFYYKILMRLKLHRQTKNNLGIRLFSIRLFTYSKAKFDNEMFRLIDSISNVFLENNLLDNKSIVLLNFFSNINHFNQDSGLKNNQKTIIIFRDPRDVFATFLLRNNTWTGVSRDNTVIENIEAFKRHYSANNIGNLHLMDEERVLVIRFETLILEFEEEVKRISRFLGHDITLETSLFDPNLSVKNIGIYSELTPIYTELFEYLLNEYPDHCFNSDINDNT